MLLEDGRADPSAQNNKAIQEASNYNCVEVVKLLLANPRVDPSVYDNIAIKSARK